MSCFPSQTSWPAHDYKRAAYQVLSIGNACMGAIFAGTARAAYELALGYARERTQGGVPHRGASERGLPAVPHVP